MPKVVNINARVRSFKDFIDSVKSELDSLDPESTTGICIFVSKDIPEQLKEQDKSILDNPTNQLYSSRSFDVHFGLLGFINTTTHQWGEMLVENFSIEKEHEDL